MWVLCMQTDEHTYTTLIKTLAYSGRIDEAIQASLEVQWAHCTELTLRQSTDMKMLHMQAKALLNMHQMRLYTPGKC